MTRWELLKLLDEQYPFDNQEEWDKSGANFGQDYDAAVTGIVLALDVTTEAIDFAKEKGANVLLTHHPLLLNDTNNPTAAKLFQKIQDAELVHIALHTCFDRSPKGTSYQIAKALGNSEIQQNPDCPYIVSFTLNLEMNLKFFAQFLSKFPLLSTIRFDKTMENRKIKTVALVAGSGSSFLGDVLKMHDPKIDCFLTGDVKWQTFIDAKENNLVVVDIGHSSEYIFVKSMKKLLENRSIPLFEIPLTSEIVDVKAVS